MISNWGYEYKGIYVGYSFILDDMKLDESCPSIESLNREVIDELLLLDKEVFDSFNITKKQLISSLSDEAILF